MCSISWSVIIGTTGATITPTGTPASLKARIARSLARGADARGSIRDAKRLSRVVTEKYTVTSRSRAIAASRSRSRSIIALLVTKLTGWRHSASTSSTSRVIR